MFMRWLDLMISFNTAAYDIKCCDYLGPTWFTTTVNRITHMSEQPKKCCFFISSMKFWRVRPVCLIRVLVTSAVLTFIYYSWNSLRSSHGQKRHLRLGPRHDNFKIKPPVNPMGDTSHAKEFDLMSLAMVNSPEDQKIRDEGKEKLQLNHFKPLMWWKWCRECLHLDVMSWRYWRWKWVA